MDSVIQKKYFIGKSKPGTWSSVYNYKPSSQIIRDKRGEVFASICLEGPKDYGLPTVGNMLLDKFHETYFENAQDSPLISLEKASTEIGKYLQKFLENDSAGDVGIDLNFISLVIFKDLAYVVGIGNGSLLIHREGQITDVSKILKDPTMGGLIKEASFVTKANDVYFIGTPETRIEIMNNEFSEVADAFNEQSLKNRLYKDESKIAFMMIGLNIDRNQPQLSKKVIREQNISENKIDLSDKDNIILAENTEIESEDNDKTLADLLQQDEDIVNPDELVEDEQFKGKHFGQEIEILNNDELDEEVVLEDNEKEQVEEIEVEMEKENYLNEEESNEQEVNIPYPPISNAPIDKKNAIITAGSGLLLKIKGLFNKNSTTRANTVIPLVNKKRDAEYLTYEEESIRPAQTTASRIAKQDLKTYQVVLIKIKDFFINLLKGTKKLVWNNWLGFDGDDLYLKSAAARQRKWGLLIVLVLVVAALLYFSIQGLVESQNQKKLEDTAKMHLDAGTKIVNDVNAQAGVLAMATGNSERKAAELVKLEKAQAEFELAKTIEKYKEDVLKQEEIIQSIKDKFDRLIPLGELNHLIDFAGKFPNANITDMVGLNNKIYAIDAKYQKLYSIDYSGVVSEIISGLNNPRSITADDKGNLIILDSDADKAIAFVDPVAKTITRMVATSNSKLSGVSQIEFYTIPGTKESRIYLLNNSDKAIAYYSRTSNSYGTYVKRNSLEELATAKDIALADGRIYLLMQKNLGLYRDYNKQEDVINVTGLKNGETLLSASAFSLEGERIFVGDSATKKIMVFKKGTPDIPLIAQYVYRGSDEAVFSDIREIIADSANGKIFVLSNSRVFVLNLESLKSFE
jgi:hypothetical protein